MPGLLCLKRALRSPRNWAIERAQVTRSRRALERTPRNERRRVVIGASGVVEPGWIATEAAFIDLLDPQTWARYFDDASLDAILAEHVWEHLSESDGSRAASTCFQFLRPGGYVRAAVPDGLHPNPKYVDYVRPRGTGEGAHDHRILYTHETFAGQFKRAGFSVDLLEYFDADGAFHAVDWDVDRGLVHRSLRFDERNHGGHPTYTSIVLDAQKPLWTGGA